MLEIALGGMCIDYRLRIYILSPLYFWARTMAAVSYDSSVLKCYYPY